MKNRIITIISLFLIITIGIEKTLTVGLMVIIIYAAYILYKKYNIRYQKELPKNTQEESQQRTLPYESKKLLSSCENNFYNILKTLCENKYIIMTKVRLEDFIETTVYEYKERNKYRNKIKSRHVDFLLLNEKMEIIYAIELDDETNNDEKAKETDEYKDMVFKQIKIPLYRIRTSDTYKERIQEIIKPKEEVAEPIQEGK